MRKASSGWSPLEGPTTNYCLAVRPPENCKLHFSLYLGIVVVASNALKLGLMCSVAFVIDIEDEPLTTMGDAVASFLKDPDVTTKNMCNLARKDFQARHKHRPWRAGARPWDNGSGRLGVAAGKLGLIACSLM